MKKISLIVICLLAMVPLQHIQANKNALTESIGINIHNGTGQNQSIYVSGPTSFSATLVPWTNSFGPVTPGNYTVTLYGQYGVNTNYVFYGQSQTNSSGYATFSVNIQYNAFGSIVPL